MPASTPAARLVRVHDVADDVRAAVQAHLDQSRDHVAARIVARASGPKMAPLSLVTFWGVGSYAPSIAGLDPKLTVTMVAPTPPNPFEAIIAARPDDVVDFVLSEIDRARPIATENYKSTVKTFGHTTDDSGPGRADVAMLVGGLTVWREVAAMERLPTAPELFTAVESTFTRLGRRADIAGALARAFVFGAPEITANASGGQVLQTLEGLRAFRFDVETRWNARRAAVDSAKQRVERLVQRVTNAKANLDEAARGLAQGARTTADVMIASQALDRLRSEHLAAVSDAMRAEMTFNARRNKWNAPDEPSAA